MTIPLCLTLFDPQHYIRPLDIVTEGRRARTHRALIEIDGTLRRCYVKAHLGCDNGLSRGLLNEIIGYTLAHHAGIPQPRGGLICLSQAQLNAIFPGACQTDTIVCFVSQEAHSPTEARSGMAKTVFSNLSDIGKDLLGWNSLGDVMMLDSWIANVDRNMGNLIRHGPRQYAVIDHGDILTGPCWHADDLQAETPYQNTLLDLVFKAERLPLPVKSAILKKASELWQIYRKAEPELHFWLNGQCLSDTLRAWHFLWKRIEWTEPHLRERTQLII